MFKRCSLFLFDCFYFAVAVTSYSVGNSFLWRSLTTLLEHVGFGAKNPQRHFRMQCHTFQAPIDLLLRSLRTLYLMCRNWNEKPSKAFSTRWNWSGGVDQFNSEFGGYTNLFVQVSGWTRTQRHLMSILSTSPYMDKSISFSISFQELNVF